MQDAPILEPEPRNLRFLRILVTVLTATMILGLLTIVALIVIRFANPPKTPVMPTSISLPDGTSALAYTHGPGWYAIVTGEDEILIFDSITDELRQRVEINR